MKDIQDGLILGLIGAVTTVIVDRFTGGKL